jgi:hypothetical protein
MARQIRRCPNRRQFSPLSRRAAAHIRRDGCAVLEKSLVQQWCRCARAQQCGPHAAEHALMVHVSIRSFMCVKLTYWSELQAKQSSGTDEGARLSRIQRGKHCSWSCCLDRSARRQTRPFLSLRRRLGQLPTRWDQPFLFLGSDHGLITTRCFCPPLSAMPSFPTTVWSPSGRLSRSRSSEYALTTAGYHSASHRS